MKIDYISDLHLEYYVKLEKTQIEFNESIARILSIIYPSKHNKAEVLFLTGDISHNINQIKWLIEYLSNDYEYIFYTHGNHEMYLYEGEETSYVKLDNLKKELSTIKNCIYLDGTTFEYKNKLIGGCSMWYDFSYGIKHFNQSKEQMKFLWKKSIRDSRRIIDGTTSDYYIKEDTGQIEKIQFDSYQHFEKEYKKLLNLKDCDIILTHVMPFIHKQYPKKYHNPETGFFMFDGSEFIKTAKVKHWFAGHTHTKTEAKGLGVRLHINPYGYPRENVHKEIMQIEIK